MAGNPSQEQNASAVEPLVWSVQPSSLVSTTSLGKRWWALIRGSPSLGSRETAQGSFIHPFPLPSCKTPALVVVGPCSALFCKGFGGFHSAVPPPTKAELNSVWIEGDGFITTCHPTDVLVGQYHPLARKKLTLSSFALSFKRTAITCFYFWFCCRKTTALCNLHGPEDPFLPVAFKRGDKKKSRGRKFAFRQCQVVKVSSAFRHKLIFVTDTSEI